jgi:hypothetical protein
MTIQPDFISTLRSINQQLTAQKFKTAKEIAGWMGALQAQDYAMSKWAFGIRLPDSTEAAVNTEINSGNIIRTHLLRPTWHFVSASDIYWILELTAPRIKAALKSRDKQLELTEAIYKKSNRTLERLLRDGNHLTREEVMQEFKRAKINTAENRGSHLLMGAELDGLICSGKQKAGKPTYTILEEWVPKHEPINRQESLKELALRYFKSHGPATIQDLSWWSGLSMSDAKTALDYNKDQLTSFVIKDNIYWLAGNHSVPVHVTGEILFLPAYDEFLISYRDRTASLALADNKKAVSNNGIFYPVILQNGQVMGTWKRIISNNMVTLTNNLFRSASLQQESAFLKGVKRYSDFIGRKIKLF